LRQRTGALIVASDGRIYTGVDEQAVTESEDRRSLVFGIRRALDTLANVGMTAHSFLEHAQPHQLWTAEEEKVLLAVQSWLNDLIKGSQKTNAVAVSVA
jgi:hypothetical protein